MTSLKNWPSRFSRAHASEYLSEKHGVKRTPGTLAKLAVVGGGPKFRKVGTRQVCYDRSALDDWVLQLIGKPFANTSGPSSCLGRVDACEQEARVLEFLEMRAPIADLRELARELVQSEPWRHDLRNEPEVAR